MAAVATVTPTSANTVTINFDDVDTSGGSVLGAPIVSYLASFGVTFSTGAAINPIVEQNPPYISVVSGPNEFGTIGLATSYFYQLDFATPLDSLSFTRPGLGSVIMASWSATAYSAANAVLDSVGEGLLFSGTSAANFTLTGPGIAYVIFNDNAFSFAGTNFRLDDLTLTTANTPLPAALPLFTSGIGVLGMLGRRRKRKSAAALAAA